MISRESEEFEHSKAFQACEKEKIGIFVFKKNIIISHNKWHRRMPPRVRITKNITTFSSFLIFINFIFSCVSRIFSYKTIRSPVSRVVRWRQSRAFLSAIWIIIEFDDRLHVQIATVKIFHAEKKGDKSISTESPRKSTQFVTLMDAHVIFLDDATYFSIFHFSFEYFLFLIFCFLFSSCFRVGNHATRIFQFQSLFLWLRTLTELCWRF